MKASLKGRIWLSGAIVLLTLATIIAVTQFNRAEPPPSINGILIPTARDLSEFTLLDHHNQPFTRQQLLGRWHIIAYGYTYCPDICPMTLTTLAQVARRIEKEQTVADVRFLFYTVDPERDTPTQLAKYVPWFHPDFVGLTRVDSAESPDLSFETSLGIVSVITPLKMDPGLEDLGGYSVSHGVHLFLLNPAAQLQAVFKPMVDNDGTQYFTAEQIYLDYRKIRAYFG